MVSWTASAQFYELGLGAGGTLFHGDVGAVAYTADVNYTNTNRDIPTLLSSWKNNAPPYNIVAREHAEGTGIVGGKKL